jgi:hypothetical protein
VFALSVGAALLGAVLLASAIRADEPGASAAKKKHRSKGTITGKLNKSGYTVIAQSDVSTNAMAVQVKRRKFKLKPPVPPGKTKGNSGKIVTLHLRAPDGSYAGPIVLASSGKSKKKGSKKSGKKGGNRVIVGVNTKAGAALGTIKIDAANGYAKAKKAPKGVVYSKRFAQARKGIPIGNGRNVGLVSSSAHGPVQDLDLDGVPNSLDVDQNGNLILNNVDPATTAVPASRGAHSSQGGNQPFMGLGTQVVGDTVNAYGSSDADIAAALRTQLWLGIGGGGVDAGSAELDCGTLSYCSAGGTGRLQPSPGSPNFNGAQGFPTPCCDTDSDGMGALSNTGGNPIFTFATQIFPGATPDQIHPGDVLIVRATRDTAPVSPVSTMGLVFSGFAALAKYDDGQGNANATPLTYPLDGVAPNIPVKANGSGDVVVSMTLWRPQRLRLATEPGSGKWVDVGGMSQFAQAQNVPGPPTGPGGPTGTCPASSYSAIGPNLTPQASVEGMPFYHLQDGKADQVTDLSQPLANTFTYSLNLTDCLASYGLSFNVAQSRSFAFWAAAPPSTGKPGNTQSLVSFTRQP